MMRTSAFVVCSKNCSGVARIAIYASDSSNEISFSSYFNPHEWHALKMQPFYFISYDPTHPSHHTTIQSTHSCIHLHPAT